MDTCKAIIYHTNKSKLPNTKCKNKAKDNNGFCLIHIKQSKSYEKMRQYEQKMGVGACMFSIIYYNNDNMLTYFKCRDVQPLSLMLRNYEERFNLNECMLYYNNIPLDLQFPCGFYANKTLTAIELGG